MKKNNIYSVFAKYYDRLMNEDRYSAWEKLIKEIVEKYQIPIGTSLDLACGTGMISCVLHKLGFSVSGVDASGHMLKIARDRCPQANFVQQDMRKYSSDIKFDLVVSFYDSLNYLLKEEDLALTFKSVNDCLKPGGVFIFDINTVQHVQVAQKFSPVIYEDDDVFAIFNYDGKDNFWDLNVDFFEKQGDNTYTRSTEHHTERGYSEENILPIIEGSNLDVLEVLREYKQDKSGNDYLSRLYFVTKKSSHQKEVKKNGSRC